MNKDKINPFLKKHRNLLIAVTVLILLLLILFGRLSRSPDKKILNGETETDSTHTDHQMNQNARVPVQVNIRTLRMLGIQIEEVKMDTISEQVRAVATIVPDESRISHIHTRVSGWLEKLYVNKTGQKVKRGSPLAGIFSQELYASQMEYLAALEASRSGPRSAVTESARTRLQVLGMTEGQIRELERRGFAMRLTTIIAPRNGVVLELNVFAGMNVDPSLVLMTIADLSKVWILVEISGSEYAGIRIGTPVVIDIQSSGIDAFESAIDFVYPSLTEDTRTLRVRLTVNNPGNLLKPGAYGTAEFNVRPRKALFVSRDAVVESGTDQYVFVMAEPGTFIPRPVQIGIQTPDRVEILDGLSQGEKVVASGVFLIDSESRLRATGGGGGAHGGHGSQESSPEGAPEEQPQERPVPDTPPGGGHQGHGG